MEHPQQVSPGSVRWSALSLDDAETFSTLLVTGASGFVGRRLLQALQHAFPQTRIRVAVRRTISGLSPEIEQVVVGDFNAHTNWAAVLSGVDGVMHLAARAHRIGREVGVNHASLCQAVNRDATEGLIRSCVQSGVRKFVLLSTVGVLGRHRDVLRDADAAAPDDPYSVSKWEAEQCVRAACRGSSTRFVVLRSPLVLGSEAPGNIRLLRTWIHRRLPLPLATVKNRRSFIYIDNLVDALLLALVHGNADNRSFLLADDLTLSTAHLVRALAGERRFALFPFPPKWIRGGLTYLGKSGQAEQLLGSLEVDGSYFRECLRWTPPITKENALLALGSNDKGSEC
ncbi:MAG: NAD-dependent epimerase/dehydratase family protein [Pseudomonadales bacterium]|nr:NAD-dependent epimerase/dehydratase family protein [Pseudomonadales bacterium]